MNRNNIYTVNPLYNGQVTPQVDETTSGGTTIIYQQGGGGGGGLTDAQKQKLDGIQEGAEVNQNAYSKVRLNNNDTLILEATSKTATLNLSGVYPVQAAINTLGGIDFTVSSDSTNTAAVVTQKQLADAIAKLEEDKYWKIDADGKLYTELDVYSQKEVSAYGAGTGGGGTGGASALYELADVLRDGDKVQGAASGSILSYNGSHWYAIPQSAITPDLTNYATKTYVSNQINELIGGAPGTLDTLKEIAEALGNDPNFAATMTDMINKIGIRVTDLEARMTSFDDMFEWDKTASASDASLWKIKAKKDLYGIGEISAYGYSSGTAPIGAQYMHELKDVLFTDLASGQLLQWNGTKWINIDKNAVGLNESELAKYLTTNNYAKKTDITWANLLNKPTTWAWVDITGKPTTLAGYGITDGVPNTRRVSAGSGLSGGGVLSSDVTISLGAIGTAGTYTKVTTDMYGRVVSSTILSESDIPTLQINKISGLQSALDSKLSTSDFSTWFTINKNASGQIVSIQANFDFFGVGEISAYGLGETQPSIYTLAGLDDVNISNPQNKQALVYDAASSKWVNGSAIGGGDISLNGTVYKPVDGIITLPVASNNKAFNEGVTYVKSDGITEIGNKLDFHDPATTNQDYDYRLSQTYDNGALLIGSGKFRATEIQKTGGTSSQFLKADGSIDDRKYALAYKDNINMVSKSDSSNTVAVNDAIYNMIPNVFDSNAVTVFYTNATTPTSDYWSGINVSGFNNSLNTTWQLGGPASRTNYNEHLHFRAGIGSTWDVNWKPLAFLEDIGNTVGNKGLYDATNGWLIKTNILDNENCMTQLYITGNSYGGLPIDTVVELYSYSDGNSILNFKVLHNGYFPSDGINAFSYGGVLCFWFAKSSIRFQSISAYCRQTNATTQINRVVSIHNYDMPTTGVTRLVNSTNYKSVRNDNFDSILGSTYVHKSGDTMTGLLTANYGILARDVRISATEEEVGEINRKATLWLQHRNWGDVGMCHAGGNILMGGKLIVDRNRYSSGAVPSISLAIGDTDTGFHWESDGIVNFMSNAKKVGEWRNTSAYLHNCSFVEASGNDYNNLGFQVRGNGTTNTVKPGLGFHQPGVYAGSLRLNGAGDFQFCVQGGSVGGQVQAGSFYANGGLLYSNNNGCQAVFGSQNTGFVHITNNATRKYYFDNSIAVSGTVYPYSDNAYDLGISTQKWNYIWGNHFMGNAASATFIQPNYIGGQQANPQTYFNNSMGVKVAMTGTPTTASYWSDTLWINGYGGTDVPSCNALHFPRDGSSEMYISSQSYNATAYGTKYRFWSSKNSNKSDVDWVCKNLSCSDSNATTAYASNWFRSRGQTGWYSQDYGGGIYMNNSDTVNIYNNKVFYNNGYRAWGIGGHNCGIKLYQANHIGINLANNSYTWGIYANQDGNMYIGRRDGNIDNSSGSYVITLGASTLSMAGNIVASGEVTAYSDIRLKSSITDLKIRGRLNPKTYVKDGKWSIGFIAQEVQALYPELIQIGESKEHYLSLNYGNITAVLAAQINSVEDEVAILKSKVEQLELEVIRLTSVNTYKR